MFIENQKPRVLLLLRVSTAKQANGNDAFDILVAFKLDRTDRKGNETTNFVTNLLEKGIRVFTVVEGEIATATLENELKGS